MSYSNTLHGQQPQPKALGDQDRAGGAARHAAETTVMANSPILPLALALDMAHLALKIAHVSISGVACSGSRLHAVHSL